MKKKLLTYLCASVFLFSSCGDSPEDLGVDMMEHMEEVVKVLEKFNDGGEAKDAISDLKDIGEDLKETAEKIKELEKDMSDEEKKELEDKMKEKHEKRMTKLMGEIQGEMVKLASSGNVGAADVQKAVTEAMSGMN